MGFMKELNKGAHQLLGLQSSKDIEAPSVIAVVFATFAILLCIVSTTVVVSLNWDTLVLEQYPLRDGYREGSTCNCREKYLYKDMITFRLTNTGFSFLSGYAGFDPENVLPMVVRDFLQDFGSQSAVVGAFNPDTFVRDVRSSIKEQMRSTASALGTAVALATNLGRQAICTSTVNLTGSYFSCFDSIALVIRGHTEFAKDIAPFVLKEIPGMESYIEISEWYELSRPFNVVSACQDSLCVLTRPQNFAEHFQSFITLLTSIFSVAIFLTALLVRAIVMCRRWSASAGESVLTLKPAEMDEYHNTLSRNLEN